MCIAVRTRTNIEDEPPLFSFNSRPNCDIFVASRASRQTCDEPTESHAY